MLASFQGKNLWNVLKKEISGEQVACLVPVQLIHGPKFETAGRIHFLSVTKYCLGGTSSLLCLQANAHCKKIILNSVRQLKSQFKASNYS